jgi:hypothetical protein
MPRVYVLASALTPPAPQLLTSLLSSWVAAQIGPIQMRLADALQVMCGAGMASTGIVMCAVLGWDAVATHPLLLDALASKHGGAWGNTHARGAARRCA